MNGDTGAPHKIVPRYDVDRRLSAADQANRDAAAPHRPRITQTSNTGRPHRRGRLILEAPLRAPFASLSGPSSVV